MPRKPRQLVVVPDRPHHVILRGNNRRRLFSYKSDYRFFLSRMARASQSFDVPVHCNMLMRNHVHLIATPADCQSISRFVGAFAQCYAQYRNRRRESSGKLFEERFKCIPITSEEQLAITTAYIELNPVQAGICDEAAAYNWSTFRLHAHLDGADRMLHELWTPSSWFLSLGGTSIERGLAYQQWFDHYRLRDDWSEVAAGPRPPNDTRRVERPDRSSAE